ncbi:MAG: hemolysin family protein [Chloroflexota bacterium]
MDSLGIVFLLGILFCLGLLGLVSAALQSMEHLRPERLERLRRHKTWPAGLVVRLSDDRPRAWAAGSTVRTVALVGMTALTIALALRWAPGAGWVSIPALLLTITLSLAVAAWARAIAVRSPNRTALAIAPAFTALLWLCRPLAGLLLDAPLAIVSRATPPDAQAGQSTAPTPASREKENYKQRMIRAVTRLADTSVREIMVPRVDIVAISTEAPLQQAVDLIIEEGYSRIPLYEDEPDHFVGVLHAKDLLPHITGHPGRGEAASTTPRRLRDIARKPYFVPETKRVDELLREMQDKRVQLAIVVDEYGGTAGLVTVEDLVEEIVGDIEDEFDVAEQQVVRISEAEAVMDGRVSVDGLERLFGVHVPSEGFDTVGGYVGHLLGRVPAVGDRVTTDDLRLDVLSTVGRRVKRVRVTRATQEARTEPTRTGG